MGTKGIISWDDLLQSIIHFDWEKSRKQWSKYESCWRHEPAEAFSQVENLKFWQRFHLLIQCPHISRIKWQDQHLNFSLLPVWNWFLGKIILQADFAANMFPRLEPLKFGGWTTDTFKQFPTFQETLTWVSMTRKKLTCFVILLELLARHSCWPCVFLLFLRPGGCNFGRTRALRLGE